MIRNLEPSSREVQRYMNGRNLFKLDCFIRGLPFLNMAGPSILPGEVVWAKLTGWPAYPSTVRAQCHDLTSPYMCLVLLTD